MSKNFDYTREDLLEDTRRFKDFLETPKFTHMSTAKKCAFILRFTDYVKRRIGSVQHNN